MTTTIVRTVTVQRVTPTRYVTIARMGRDAAILTPRGNKGTDYVTALSAAVAYAKTYGLTTVHTPDAVLHELSTAQAAEVAEQMRASDERWAARHKRTIRT